MDETRELLDSVIEQEKNEMQAWLAKYCEISLKTPESPLTEDEETEE